MDTLPFPGPTRYEGDWPIGKLSRSSGKEAPNPMYFVHVDEVTHLFGLRGPALLSRRKLSRGIEEERVYGWPRRSLKRKKRIMDLARVRSGEPEGRRNFLGPMPSFL
jgi:hypothetical protein